MAQDAAAAFKRLAYNMSACSGQQVVTSERLLQAAVAFIRQASSST
jgi:hypothetical protein